jgi:hypothetical protein
MNIDANQVMHLLQLIAIMEQICNGMRMHLEKYHNFVNLLPFMKKHTTNAYELIYAIS